MQNDESTILGPHSDEEASRTAIQRLLDRELFRIAYQPIVDLRRDRAVGFEALTRLDRDAGFQSPGDLYEIAERIGMLWELEGASRRLALQGARSWPEDVQLFMNCAPTVAEDERFEKLVCEEIEGNRYPAQVVVEITERSPHLDMATLMPRIDALRQRGFQIAIDDVGIGASGLVRISSLRPGWLKLDRALISEIDKDRFRWNLVRHLVGFARACGVQVIAEGIEREEELRACRDLAICFGQGFLLSKPTFEPMRVLEQPSACPSVSVRGHDALPASATMLQGVHPPMCVEHTLTLASAAQQLIKDVESPGICVTRDGRLLGWVRREDAMHEAAQPHRGGAPVSTIARRVPCIEIGSVDFSELFELAATHAQFGSDMPILVMSGGLPQAMLTTPTLLSMAADLARYQARTESQASANASLPGPAACLRHLDHLLDGSTIEMHDVAVIELRGLNGFNLEHGYDAGERLMTHLAESMRRASAGGFVGHLGMEVYLMTLPSGAAPSCLRDTVRRFEVAKSSEPGAGEVRLNAVEVTRINDRFGSSRDLLHYAAARRSEGVQTAGSTVIPDELGVRSRSA